VSVSGRTVTIAAQPFDTFINFQFIAREPHAWVWWDLGAPGSIRRGRSSFPTCGRTRTAARASPSCSRCSLRRDGLPERRAERHGADARGEGLRPAHGTTRWSENPALLARHVYQHPQFGKATVSAAEDTRFIAAANACDVAQNWTWSTARRRRARCSALAP
jgi:hypothetical protein